MPRARASRAPAAASTIVSVKTRIDSNSGASEVSCVNGRGFNFDVAPSLVGIGCPLISRVGDSEMSEVRSKVRGSR